MMLVPMLSSAPLPLLKLSECRQPPSKQLVGEELSQIDFYQKQEEFLRKKKPLLQVEKRPPRIKAVFRKKKVLPMMRYRELPKQSRHLHVPPIPTKLRRQVPRREVYDYENMHGGAAGFWTLGEGFGAANDVSSWMQKFSSVEHPSEKNSLVSQPDVKTDASAAEEDTAPAAAAVSGEGLKERRKDEDTSAVLRVCPKPPIPKATVAATRKLLLPAVEEQEPKRSGKRVAVARKKLSEKDREMAQQKKEREIAESEAFLDSQVMKVLKEQPEAIEAEKRQRRYLQRGGRKPSRGKEVVEALTESEPHLRNHRHLLERYQSALLHPANNDDYLAQRFAELTVNDERREEESDKRQSTSLAVSWHPGDRCRCLWPEDSEWYPGRVAVSRPHDVDVVFDDGDERSHVPFSDLELPDDDPRGKNLDEEQRMSSKLGEESNKNNSENGEYDDDDDYENDSNDFDKEADDDDDSASSSSRQQQVLIEPQKVTLVEATSIKQDADDSVCSVATRIKHSDHFGGEANVPISSSPAFADVAEPVATNNVEKEKDDKDEEDDDEYADEFEDED